MGAAKAGVDPPSASIAVEYGPMGITSNVITLGPISETEGMERLSNKEGESKAKHTVLVGHWGHKKEIADATVYLFSDAGNSVNGARFRWWMGAPGDFGHWLHLI